MQTFSCDECGKPAIFFVRATTFVRQLDDEDADALTTEAHSCASCLASYAPGELAERFTAKGKKKRGPPEEKTSKKR